MRPPTRGRPAPAALLLGEGPLRRLALPILCEVPGLLHGFTLRGSDPDRVLREAAGRPLPLRTPRQAHGATVRCVTSPAAPQGEGDALITSLRGVALGVRAADCVPILICDRRAGAVAAVHAGWRGTVAGVLAATLERMRTCYGSRAADLRVALGPAIGACCYEVGEEVAEALLRSDPEASDCILPGIRPRVDLVGANRRQALRAGVPEERIQSAGRCTFCGGDSLESHRRSRGAARRMTGLIAWRE
ncbi:MAG: peptidoglycan editing factor PgeF [Acidobacteriota bacterium]